MAYNLPLKVLWQQMKNVISYKCITCKLHRFNVRLTAWLLCIHISINKALVNCILSLTLYPSTNKENTQDLVCRPRWSRGNVLASKSKDRGIKPE